MTDEKQKRGRPKLASTARLELALSKVSVFAYVDYKKFLEDVFFAIKSNEKYSYNQFAEDLGFPKSNVIWMVITGRRKLLKPSAKRVCQALRFLEAEKKYFEAIVEHNNANTAEKREALTNKLVKIKKSTLSDQQHQLYLEFFSQWYHSAIHELVGLAEFQSDPNWIRKKLRVKVKRSEIEASLALLVKLGMVAYDSQEQKYVITESTILPDKNLKSMVAMRYHQKMCEIARDSVALTPAALRDFNALTVKLSEDKIAAAKKILFEACEKILSLDADDQENASEVYQFNMQMFPLTGGVE